MELSSSSNSYRLYLKEQCSHSVTHLCVDLVSILSFPMLGVFLELGVTIIVEC